MNRFHAPLFLGALCFLAGCSGSTPPSGDEPCTRDEHCVDAHDCTVDSCGVDGFCRHVTVDAVCGGALRCDVHAGCVSTTDGGAGDVGAGDGGDAAPGNDAAMTTDAGQPGQDTGTGMDAASADDAATGTDSATPPGDAGMDAAGCTTGARRCSGAALEVCAAGAYVFEQMCALDCSAGACTTSVTCTPSAYRCNARSVEVCNSAGTAWLHVSTCANTCSAGLCTGACTPAERRCNGSAVEQCDAAGTAWTTVQTCAATFCAYGTCALDGLDVASNMDLDGEVLVDGDVLVRSGATLRSPGGDLTIRARTITVESGGSIAVSATGLGPDGVGQDGRFCSGGFNGGSGGGHGTSGTIGPTGSSGSPCTSGGPAFGSATDSVVGRGGPGGGVSGSSSPRSPGGGRLRLVASDRITVQGQISADGLPGIYAAGSSGLSTGGGAGGGVLLAADTVIVSGAITAAGAGLTSGTWGGTGGQGRIKILTGAMRSVTGTLTGAVLTQGLLPPIDLVSSSHPDPSLYYNDDFAFATVSWERPFPGRQGYYWVVDAMRYRVPTPAIGTFAAAEAVSVARSALVAGDNYVHVAPIDAMSAVGTVETSFRIRLNTTPPMVTSSSHPSETAWSTNHDAFFSWTVPNGAANYTGFYYSLDHYGDTVPTAADTYLPVTQTTLLRSALADGIWVVHVVSIDTHGYLTRVAGHRQVRLGADPGAGGLVGQVVSAATSMPISGARVRVNRGLVADQTTNGTGNYNFMGVPAGTWDVEVSAPGFATMTRSVTITASGSVPLNVSLAPM